MVTATAEKYVDAEPYSAAPKNETKIRDSVAMYLSDIAQYKVMTPEEERYQFTLVAKGDANAKEYCINHNLRLVVPIARQYWNQSIDFSDLIQYGNLGLIKAVDLFDVTKGYHFSTYATFWIRQSIIRNIGNNEHSGIRIPLYMNSRLKSMKDAEETLRTELGFIPSEAEVAAFLGWETGTVSSAKKAAASGVLISLDELLTEGEGVWYDAQNNSEDKVVNVEEMIISKMASEKLAEILHDNLTEREEQVIRARFGIGATKVRLQDLGALFGVTRERVRQIEQRALLKLRNCKDCRVLSDLYFN